MLTCCLRSSLIVKDETPTSYLPPWTPVMIEEKSAGWNSASHPQLRGDGVEHVDVHALHRLAVAGQELVGRVAGVGADLDHPGVADLLRQLGGEVGVELTDDRGRALAGGLAAQRVRAAGAQRQGRDAGGGQAELCTYVHRYSSSDPDQKVPGVRR